MAPSDLTALDAAVKRITRLAGRLGSGEAEAHVQRSLAELAAALGRQDDDPSAATQRLLDSLRQLQHTRDSGRRRDEQRGAAGIERVLEAIQEDLLPILRRSLPGRAQSD